MYLMTVCAGVYICTAGRDVWQSVVQHEVLLTTTHAWQPRVRAGTQAAVSCRRPWYMVVYWFIW